MHQLVCIRLICNITPVHIDTAFNACSISTGTEYCLTGQGRISDNSLHQLLWDVILIRQRHISVVLEEFTLCVICTVQFYTAFSEKQQIFSTLSLMVGYDIKLIILLYKVHQHIRKLSNIRHNVKVGLFLFCDNLQRNHKEYRYLYRKYQELQGQCCHRQWHRT